MQGDKEMISREQLIHMRNMSFDEAIESEISIPDIQDIDIDVSKSKQEKIGEVLTSGRNPYFFRSGSVLVKIGFASTNRTIDEALESLINLKI